MLVGFYSGYGVCSSGEEGECEWGVGCAGPTHHQPIHTSISLPSGGGVRREKEEMKEGMQMATEPGTLGSTRPCGVKGSSVSVTRHRFVSP